MTLLLLLLACVKQPPQTDLEARLESEVQALRVKNQLLEERLARCADEQKGVSPELARQLYQVFAGTEVLVERRDGMTLLVLPADLLFPPESLTLRQEAVPLLDLLATALTLHPDERVWIVGHAEKPPKTPSLLKQHPGAWEWSEAQAAVVMRALVKQFGIDPARIVVAGRGSASPLSQDDTPEGHARNRRVEIVFGAALP